LLLGGQPVRRPTHPKSLASQGVIAYL